MSISTIQIPTPPTTIPVNELLGRIHHEYLIINALMDDLRTDMLLFKEINTVDITRKYYVPGLVEKLYLKLVTSRKDVVDMSNAIRQVLYSIKS